MNGLQRKIIAKKQKNNIMHNIIVPKHYDNDENIIIRDKIIGIFGIFIGKYVVYFKNSGEPVFFRATVSRVFQFENLTPQRVKEILERYGKEDGVSREQMPFFFKLFKDKRYCILVFLVRPQRVRQFFINKKGFGAMASWISISSVNSIKY